MWGIASAWLPIFYHTHISAFLSFNRFTGLISRSQRSGGIFSQLQNAIQQYDCLYYVSTVTTVPLATLELHGTFCCRLSTGSAPSLPAPGTLHTLKVQAVSR